jgi:excisionase family DNA binding protein
VPPAERWVSVRDVAQHLGVRKDSVYRWIEQRELPARKIGKLWKLKLSEVDVWVRARNEPRAAANAPAILVIDDEALVRESVAEFLVDEGFGVLVAADGAEAFQLLGRSPTRPALILLDLKMPNLDGWRFRELQLKDPALAAIPVIVISAAIERPMAGTTMLRKPLRLPELAGAISAALGTQLQPKAVAR